MNLVKTKSFDLAIISEGNQQSDKIAIALPGRLDTKDYACFHSHIHHLAKKGFFALSFDPPGTWQSPGTTELFTTTNYIQAVNELIEHFDNRPTFLLGHSRGGTVAILVGVSNPLVKAFSPIMATYGEPSPPDEETIKKGFKISYRDMPPGSTKTSEQKQFKLTMQYFLDGEKYNVVDELKECRKPKLLLYGTNDQFTAPKRVKEVFDQCSDPKVLRELKSDHDYRYHADVINEVNREIGAFLEQYPIE